MPRVKITIPLEAGESYQDSLKRRLEKYDITQRELAQESGFPETRISRWLASPSAKTGEPISIQMNNVLRLEEALVRIRVREGK